MTRTVVLDTNPKRPPETVGALTWAIAMLRAEHRLIVPAIADYEVRRELERAGKTAMHGPVPATTRPPPAPLPSPLRPCMVKFLP